jgi:hypothetical protein
VDTEFAPFLGPDSATPERTAMDRRRAFATVAAIVCSGTALAVAVGATTRVFNAAEASPGVGRISPVRAATGPPIVEHRVIDVVDPAPPAAASPAPSTAAPGEPLATPTTRPVATAAPAAASPPATAAATHEHEHEHEDD